MWLLVFVDILQMLYGNNAEELENATLLQNIYIKCTCHLTLHRALMANESFLK